MSVVARRIDRYLRAHGSPLAGLGSVIETAGRHYGVDPYLIVAITGAETSLGTDPNAAPDVAGHNAWGWGPHIKFGSWAEAVDRIAHGLRTGYIDEGRTTIGRIGAKWAPAGATNDPTGLNSNWSRNVSRFYSQVAGKQPAGGGLAAPPQPRGLPPIGKPPAAQPVAAASGSLLDPLLLGLVSQTRASVGLPELSPTLTALASLPDPVAPSAAAAGPKRSQSAGGPASPSPSAGGTPSGGLAEAFYDPLGSWDNGRFGGPIGGHSDHVHLSITNPQTMLAAIAHAQQLGLHVGENPYVGAVNPVHVAHSFHYRTFSGRYHGRRLGEAIDVSGSSKLMAEFYRWAVHRLR